MILRRLFESVSARPDDIKASKAGPLVALQGAGRAVWTPRDYAALAREGYARNPVVHRSVRLIAEAAASVPMVLYDGERELDRHPLLELLARPNPAATGAGLMEEVYGHLLVAGNAYLERVNLEGRVRELHALRPDRVRIVPGADGWPEAYDYTVSGRTVRFSREAGGGLPVLHLKIFHPLNDHYGFAPIEAAQMSLDIHNAASNWNKALLDNAARPSGALVYGAGEAANLSDDQFERLKTELEAGYQGARNAGRPLLLEGGLDWKPMGLAPKDMDFIEAKNQAAREIALAFGVPPMLLGIPGDNTFANYQEANRAFWRQSVLPLATRALDAVGRWLSPAFGEGLRLAPDPDRVEALSVEREALWRRVEAASFLSRDEKRVAVGYGVEEGGA
ncbi:phage portal protein [Stappia sp. F7233]|uniref:Phage portal protein n=1 Tax=Stappia albiluteola TaxID=2758565 RepID=A0A839ABD7_9HYPH|nr:phage portal protein [Stappia albiluteola]MBA5776358.1 phage portal protein [Stappia albiluteola]